MSTNLAHIPGELAAPAKWIPYYLRKQAGKKASKSPIAAYASDADKKENFRSLSDWTKSKPGAPGFQRWIDPSEGFVFVDLDRCRDPKTGAVADWAQEIVDSLNTYTEISESGKGLHLVGRGKLPADFYLKGDGDESSDYRPNKVEIYSGHKPNKLMAMTGNLLPGLTPATIQDCQEAIAALLAKLQNETGHSEAEKQPSQEFEESVVICCMDDVKELPIEWLWPNRIPLSAVTAFTGNPDTGKTMAYCDLVARVTTSRDFPDAEMPQGVGGEVLMLCSEDDYARVIKPRLMAASANTKAVFYVDKVEIRQGAKRDERMFALDTDLSKLEKELAGNPLCSLIIIDPISSYFGKGNMNNKQDVRAVFNRLTAMCEKYRVAIVAIEHFNKRVDVAAIHKMGGSVALTAATRAAFMFAKVPDEENQHVMHFVKGNFAKRKVGLRFTIEGKKIGTIGEVPFIVWGAEDTGTADDLLMAEKGVSETSRAARAEKFLREYLTEEKPADEVLAEAKKRNVSRDALYEVKKELGIRADKRGGQWLWQPPESWRTPKPRGAQPALSGATDAF